jgi:hypothetical protein
MGDPLRDGKQPSTEDENLVSRRGFQLMIVVIVLWFSIGILTPAGTALGRWHDEHLVQGLILFPNLILTFHGLFSRETGDTALGATFVMVSPLLWMPETIGAIDFVPHMLPLAFVPLGIISIVAGIAEPDDLIGQRMVQGGLAVIAVGAGLFALLHAVDRYILDVDAWMGWLIDVLPEE